MALSQRQTIYYSSSGRTVSFLHLFSVKKKISETFSSAGLDVVLDVYYLLEQLTELLTAQVMT